MNITSYFQFNREEFICNDMCICHLSKMIFVELLSFFELHTVCCRFHPLVGHAILSTPACPGPPQNPRLVTSVPPNVDLLWDRPSTADMWSFMYRIDWQNGTSAVGDTTDMRGTLSGLKGVTQYAVTITAFTDSTLCPEQSINFTFNTTQSEC